MAHKAQAGDERRISELSLDELEGIVAERKRIERARTFADADDTRRFSPITIQPNEKQKRRQRRGWKDNVLFVVEVVAVLGLVGIIVAALLNLQALNHEVAAAIQGSNAPPVPQPVTHVVAV